MDAARPVAEGYYTILDHSGHTHLAYVLEQPRGTYISPNDCSTCTNQQIDPLEVQKAFNITKEGSFVIAIKNPEVTISLITYLNSKHHMQRPGSSFLGISKKANYPPDLQGFFRGKRWAAG